MLSNPWIIIVATLALGAAGTGLWWHGHSYGYDKRTAEYEKTQREASDAARKIERDAVPCSNDPTCVLPDPFRRRVQGVQPDSSGR